MKTIRLRMPAFVTAKGDWAAEACRQRLPEESEAEWEARMMDYLKTDFPFNTDPKRVCWIEVDVPRPDNVTVEGRVVDDV